MPIEHGIENAISHAADMDSHRSIQAQDTAAILQEAARGGSRVMIPGALEPRVARRPTARPGEVAAESVTDNAPAPAANDPERLEHERAGGGAPSERTARQQRTILAKLWHCLFHPTDLPIMWREPLPQHR